MKKDLTELVFILDRSGSMAGLENDTVGGFNSMLEQQKAVDGECRITTALFSTGCTLLHDRTDIRAVAPMTQKEYRVGGGTALLDAIGSLILKTVAVQKHTAEDYRAGKVLFVIITDGEENSSSRYSSDDIKAMIRHETDVYGWEFLFLGANIDAVETAARFGIGRDRAQTYLNDREGVKLNYTVMSEAVTSFRTDDAFPCGWADRIESDVKSRKPKK